MLGGIMQVVYRVAYAPGPDDAPDRDRIVRDFAATTGREAIQSRTVGPRERAVSASFSAWTATGRPSRAAVASGDGIVT